MARYVVEMYGLPYEIAKRREVEVRVEDGARLGDIIAALRREIPALEGDVIRTGEDRLVERYMFNINGRFYFDNEEPKLKDGDHLRLLTLATAG
jgi:molybdopterin converting factor small subunit